VRQRTRESRAGASRYAVLGVTPAVSAAELNHAFRVLVRQHHPDTRPTDAAGASPSGAASDQRLQQILAAYTVLRDPARRAAYDRRRAQRLHRQVLNEHWPLSDKARRMSHGRDPIDVRARLVFARDGETWLNGRAVACTRSLIKVYVPDDRLRVKWVWLLPADVRVRRSR
jgi:curved DNA-binding protein CbpA